MNIVLYSPFIENNPIPAPFNWTRSIEEATKNPKRFATVSAIYESATSSRCKLAVILGVFMTAAAGGILIFADPAKIVYEKTGNALVPIMLGGILVTGAGIIGSIWKCVSLGCSFFYRPKVKEDERNIEHPYLKSLLEIDLINARSRNESALKSFNEASGKKIAIEQEIKAIRELLGEDIGGAEIQMVVVQVEDVNQE